MLLKQIQKKHIPRKKQTELKNQILKTEQRQNKDEQGLVKEVAYQQDDFIDNSEHQGPNK